MFLLKKFSLSLGAFILIACSQATVSSEAIAQETASFNDEMRWTMLDEESHLKFTAKQEGQAFSGEFPVFTSDIVFDPDNLAASNVVVTIPLDQVEAGTRDRNATLPGKVWFSTKKFPEAVFTSTKIEATGNEIYVAKGALTLKGQTKDFDLPFRLEIGEVAVMTSEVTLDRTMWNIGEDPWHTDEWVSKSVTLDIQVTAKR